MKSQQSDQQNTHGVPERQWKEFGPLGQQFYNELFDKGQRTQKELISSLNIPSGDKTKYEQKINESFKNFILETTNQYVTQSQLSEQDE